MRSRVFTSDLGRGIMTQTSAPTTGTGTYVPAKEDPSKRLGAQRFAIGSTAVGPLSFLSRERARLAEIEWKHFTVKRVGATIGAELHDIDITKPLSAEVLADVKRALAEFKVIFFRNQHLTSAQHIEFAKSFGELETHPFLPGSTEHPELVRFEKSAEVGGYENLWHHDVTWREVPSMGAILHSIHVPASGGDTLFCDMYAAYDGLDEETKWLIDDMYAVHDFMLSFGAGLPEDEAAKKRAQYPQVRHPVAPVHPVTGRRYLYVNRNFVSHIEGVSTPESKRLIEHLMKQSEIVEFQCRFHWENDSVAFWDNHATQHYASSDYWPDLRIMERASIVGHRPFK